MTVEVRCSNCGAVAAPGARYCMSCGRDLSGHQRPVSTSTSPSASIHGQLLGPPPDLIDRLRAATLGDYEILAELGRGGMATVFLAHDIQLDRKVAIKLMHPQAVPGEGLVERFKLEARTAAGLSHANIIPIYAVKHTGDLVYFVMKFVQGRPLDSILREGKQLPVAMVRTVLTKVGEALAYAHRHGVVHRDIKPANIMIDTEGMPIVTDFGIAKVSESQGLTMTGATIGTPTYMSPEQCNAQTITGASDQYSLGVMAFEMLVGRPPYEGDSVVNIMFKHVHGEVPKVGDFGPGVPHDLAEAVVRMMQKEPGDRWPSMDEAIPALRGTAGTEEDSVRTQMIEFAMAGVNRQILARVSTPRSPFPATGRKPLPSTEPTRRMTAPTRSPSRLWAIVAAVVVLAAGGGALVLWHPWSSGTAAPISTAPSDTVAAPAATGTPSGAVPESAAAVAAAESTQAPPAAVEKPVQIPSPPVARDVQIVDPPDTLAEGQTVALNATVLDRQGRRINTAVRWSSSAPDVAAVQPDGQLRAMGAGSATLTAQVGDLRAQANVTVTAVVASLTVTPASGDLRPGQAMALKAMPLGRDGSALTGRAMTWRSSDEAVAVVSSAGRVTAVGPGTATVTASSEGQVGSARITVTAPAPVAAAPETVAPPPPVDPRPAIADLVRAYAHALETKDISRVKALYPGITAAIERRTRDALQAMDDLAVRLTPSQVTVDGTNARARVTGEWTYHGGKLDVDNVYVFERRAAGWVIVAIN